MLARENPQIGRNDRYWGRFAGKDMPSSQGLSGLQKYLDDCLAVDRGRFDVLDVAVRIALVSAAAGIVMGLAVDSFLGAVLAHWMQNAFAASSLFAAAVLLALSALLARLLPARHAITVPPTEALRYE
jgi:hypothetical protein